MNVPEIVALSAIALGCAAYGFVASRPTDNHVPARVWNRKIDVIDVDSLETLEVKVGPFEKEYPIDRDTGYKITPDGRMVSLTVQCLQCDERVPRMPGEGLRISRNPDDLETRLSNYVCVRCGGFVYRQVAPEPENAIVASMPE